MSDTEKIERTISIAEGIATPSANNDDTNYLLENQEDRFDSQFNKLHDQLEMQNKIIEEQNRTIMDIQKKMEIQDKRHEDEMKCFLKMAEDSNIHLIEKKLNNFSYHQDSYTIDCEIDVSSKYSSEFGENNENQRLQQDAVVFDIPTFFTFIFRFAYVIVAAITIDYEMPLITQAMWSRKMLNGITGVLMTLSIIFEMISARLDGEIKKVTFCYYILSAIFLWTTYATYESSGTEQREILIAGIIAISAELMIIIQLIHGKMPKTLSAAHLFGALSILFLLLGIIYQSTLRLILFVFFSSCQSIFLLFGLPLIEKRDFDPSHKENEINHNPNIAYNNNSSVPNDEDLSMQQNFNYFKSVTKILNLYERRLEILESNNNQTSNNYDDDKPETQLSTDVYTMMIMTEWTQNSFRNPFSRCRENPEIIVISYPSKAWMLGMVVFTTQIILGSFALVDQVSVDFGDTILDIPIRVSPVVQVGQFIALILSVLTQTDVSMAFRVLLLLSWKKQAWQKLLEHEKNSKSLSFWLGRVLFPNFLKSLQGLVILGTTFIVIIQSNNVVSLLKDFTALFVVSMIDDMFFFIAEHGYLGAGLKKTTNKVKGAAIEEDESNIQCWLILFLLGTSFVVFGFWIVVVVYQMNGSLIIQKYPSCTLEFFYYQIGDGRCDYPKDSIVNTLDCGWEGGDCLVFNERYPTCSNVIPYKINNGNCDHNIYNTKECGWDGGDCLKENYPDCIVENPIFIGNGRCENEGNKEECGFDGGDCVEFNSKYPNCTVPWPELLGNGLCVQQVNNVECGFDGGDCIEFNRKFPDCVVEAPFRIGDGNCDGQPFDTVECGFDGGDCLE